MKKGLLAVLFLLFLLFVCISPAIWGGPEGVEATARGFAILIGVPLGVGGTVAIIYLLVLLTEGWTKFQDWYKERQ